MRTDPRVVIILVGPTDDDPDCVLVVVREGVAEGVGVSVTILPEPLPDVAVGIAVEVAVEVSDPDPATTEIGLIIFSLPSNSTSIRRYQYV